MIFFFLDLKTLSWGVAMDVSGLGRHGEGVLCFHLSFRVLQWKTLNSISFKLGGKPKAMVQECSDLPLLADTMADRLGTRSGECLTKQARLFPSRI